MPLKESEIVRTIRRIPRRTFVHSLEYWISAAMGLIVRSSAIHAAGCYTTTPIRKGERFAEYSGRRIHKDVADRLYENYPVTYLFGLGDGTTVIDGFCTAMFINHSCDGNAETIEEDERIWIVAIRDIPAETEITYDYCLYDGGDDEPCTCYCGSPKCRGSMYSPEELKRRKAAARKAAQKKRTPPAKRRPTR